MIFNNYYNVFVFFPFSEDVLIFLTGQEEIDSLVETINEAIKVKLLVLIL